MRVRNTQNNKEVFSIWHKYYTEKLKEGRLEEINIEAEEI